MATDTILLPHVGDDFRKLKAILKQVSHPPSRLFGELLQAPRRVNLPEQQFVMDRPHVRYRLADPSPCGETVVEHSNVSQSDAQVVITRSDGTTEEITATLRIDTPIEVDYYRHGGILPFVLRQLLS